MNISEMLERMFRKKANELGISYEEYVQQRNREAQLRMNETNRRLKSNFDSLKVTDEILNKRCTI